MGKKPQLILFAVLVLGLIGGTIYIFMQYQRRFVQLQKSKSPPPQVIQSPTSIQGQIRFERTGRVGPSTHYAVSNGIITGEWTAVFGSNIHGGPGFYFIPSTSSREKLPKNRFGTSARKFLLRQLQNGFQVTSLFGIDLEKLETSSKACEVKGGQAIIVIYAYDVLEAEIGGTDAADLEKVISYTPATTQECW
jgi:hypothetical protein